jgi:hypothetical protein
MLSGALMSKLVFIVVVAVLLLGLFPSLISRIPFLGRLPGDFRWQHKGAAHSFPLASSLVLSMALTLLLNLVFKK